MGDIQFCVIVMLLYDVLFAVTRQARYLIMGNIMVWFAVVFVLVDIYSRVFGGK